MLIGVALLAGCAASGSSMAPATSPMISPEGTSNLVAPSSEPSAAVPAVRPTSGETVDGFKIGVMVACSPGVGLDAAELDRGCAGFPKRATAALDAREPDHPDVLGFATYSDGTQPEPLDYSADVPSPTPPPTAHPGPDVTVFVFTLADGTFRATGVACTRNDSNSSCVGIGAYPDF
jgi:hypothetical protein